MLSLKARPAANDRLCSVRTDALELLALTGSQSMILNERLVPFLTQLRDLAVAGSEVQDLDARFAARAITIIVEDALAGIGGEVSSASRVMDVLLDLMPHLRQLPG